MAPPSVAEQLEAVIANVPGAIYRCLLDGDWTMEFISEEIEQLCGHRPDEFVGKGGRSFATIIHPDDRGHVQAAVALAVAEDEAFAIEYRLVGRDDQVVWVLERGRASGRNPDGARWLDGVICDVTERRHLEEALRLSLSDAAATRERLNLARDLHDAVGHALSIGAIQAGGARNALRTDTDAAEVALEEVESIMRVALREMREMVSALHGEVGEPGEDPARLDDLVIGATRAGLDIRVVEEGERADTPDPVMNALYRAVQECLTNCAKHAAGARISVRIHHETQRVTLEVTDDGAGCVPPADLDEGGGRGLQGIRDRAHELGGRFASTVRDGGGFQVSVSYPCQRVLPGGSATER